MSKIIPSTVLRGLILGQRQNEIEAKDREEKYLMQNDEANILLFNAATETLRHELENDDADDEPHLIRFSCSQNQMLSLNLIKQIESQGYKFMEFELGKVTSAVFKVAPIQIIKASEIFPISLDSDEIFSQQFDEENKLLFNEAVIEFKRSPRDNKVIKHTTHRDYKLSQKSIKLIEASGYKYEDCVWSGSNYIARWSLP
jgi:hypothetical protein